MDDVVACCSECGKTVKGKIYDGYLCADCRIKVLDESILFANEAYTQSQKDVNKWISKYNEESIAKTKYKFAFDALFEKINSKQ